MQIALRIAVTLVLLKLLVWWLEPRMAFFPIRGVQATPAAVGLPFSDITIDTTDGETLHAWWLEHPEATAQVVYFHGNGGNLSLWLDIAVQLRRRGFSVFAVDYRGYGASTGTPSERGLYRDAEASARAFEERYRRPGSPVVHWGRSIGAPVAAHAASVVAPDALVLETPMPDVRSVLRSNPVMWLLSFLSSYRFPTSRLLERYSGPLLVVHGDADSIVPFSAGRRVFEAAPTRHKTLLVVEGAGHNDLHAVDPRRYWRGIDAFVATLREERTPH
ncbi:MAG TPA: alpha/beta hydrolase [Vicinamibacterales bacterium]|nr:alpha/beta hydrolase [Vicinamibacterales bacterium]